MLPHLYAILDVELTAARGLAPLDVCAAWLDAGVRLIQLRGKSLPGGALLELADGCAALARAAGADFIVNDRADIAVLSGARGVHVGQNDLSAGEARAQMGPEAIVGVSTHNEEQLREALAAPVNYVAIGPVFTTSSKLRPDPVVGLEGVALACRLSASSAESAASAMPIVAIGGITLETAPAVLAAGASAVAVISDLLTTNPAARARQYLDVTQGQRAEGKGQR